MSGLTVDVLGAAPVRSALHIAGSGQCSMGLHEILHSDADRVYLS